MPGCGRSGEEVGMSKGLHASKGGSSSGPIARHDTSRLLSLISRPCLVVLFQIVIAPLIPLVDGHRRPHNPP